jgi:hypothetical protein
VARRLLQHPLVETTVFRTLLSAVAIYAVGCIIPTPLEAEKPSPNHPPIITGATEPVDFQQSPLYTAPSRQAQFAFNVNASDEDVGDTLVAYLAYINGGTLGSPLQSGIMTASSTDLTARSAEFLPGEYCVNLNLTSGRPYPFFVYVVDIALPQPVDLTTLTPADERYAGHYDFKDWVVTCP